MSVSSPELFHCPTSLLSSAGTVRRCGTTLMALMEETCTDPITKETCYARVPGIRKRFSSAHTSLWLDELLAQSSVEPMLRIGKRTLASSCCTVRSDCERN